MISFKEFVADIQNIDEGWKDWLAGGALTVGSLFGQTGHAEEKPAMVQKMEQETPIMKTNDARKGVFVDQGDKIIIKFIPSKAFGNDPLKGQNMLSNEKLLEQYIAFINKNFNMNIAKEKLGAPEYDGKLIIYTLKK